MFKKILSIVLCLILVLSLLPTTSIASSTHSNDSNQVNGEIIVYILKDNKWLEAGRLAFGRFVQEKKLEILDLKSFEGFVTLKLIKNGGGNAHLDFISFGEKTPVTVDGETTLIRKLSKLDFDVINLDENGIEVTIPTDENNRVLSVSARIESTVISKTPFLFPIQKLDWLIDENSSFFTYELNSVLATPEIDNMLETMTTQDLFFKQHCLPASGHPQGYIYGWVMNDHNNLYVLLDVTPDNTRDGDKDYAMVYVKTDAGVKEFKITESETKWGRASFAYTDKVEYQHKVYEFVIPLEEVDIKEANNVKDIFLAFSFYGTASDPIYFEKAIYDFDEAAGTVTVRVFRPGGTSEWVTRTIIDYQISDITATYGQDYATDSLSGKLVFKVGTTELSIPITIIDDIEDEDDIESINISIWNDGYTGSGYVSEPSEVVLNIADNDEPAEEQSFIYFHAPSYSFAEGSTGQFYIARDCNDYEPITVGYKVVDGSASYDDDYFIERTGTIKFESGMSQTSGPLMTFYNDRIEEENENFYIELCDIPEGYTLKGTNSTEIIIEDREYLPLGGIIEFDSENYTVDEDNPGYAEITVRYYPSYEEPMFLLSSEGDEYDDVVTVVYSTSDGSATEGKDYVNTTGILTFDTYEYDFVGYSMYFTETFTIPIINDQIDENNETINLTLSDPTGYVELGLNKATLTIIDDDETIVDDNNDDYPVVIKKIAPKTKGLPEGTIIDRMKGYIVLSEPKEINRIKEEITLSYDEKLLKENPKHTPRIYYWNSEKENWVALATYPTDEGKVKAINDSGYKGWFVVFGVIQPEFIDLENHWEEQLINRMNGLGMIEGYEVKGEQLLRTAKTEQNVTKAEFAMLISRILNIDIDDPKLPLIAEEEAKTILKERYTDSDTIPAWVLSTVGTLEKANLLIELTENFDANSPITRIEAGVITSKALKYITECKTADLSRFIDKEDIPDWAREELVEEVLIAYPDESIRPYDNLTRVESLMLLYRLFVEGMGW